MNNANTRVYSCEVILYCCETALLLLLESHPDISHYLYIMHNKDLNEDGTRKKTHFHLYVTFKRNLSFAKIARDFSNILLPYNSFVYVENICSIKGSLSDCYLYATHKTNPEKWQYADSDLKSDKISHFRRSKGSSLDIGWQILEDMENGFTMRQMAIKYGREYIINYSRYDEFFRFMIADERPRLKPCDDDDDVKPFA